VSTFKLGFTGSTLDVIVPWELDQAQGYDRVLVAMAGSGKDIAALAQGRSGSLFDPVERRLIQSHDPQYVSHCAVHGVFSQLAGAPVPLERGEAVGYTSTAHPIRQMPPDAERLADHIAMAGTLYDRASLIGALVRCTYMGRLGTWAREATASDMWERYLRQHSKLAAWRGLEADFDHRHGSVFDAPDLAQQAEGALLHIDTPKVLKPGKRGDIYSAGWEGLNSILKQDAQALPPWTRDTFVRDMPLLWELPWRRMLMFHATGCAPDVPEVDAMLRGQLGEPTQVQRWAHRTREDVCWVYDR
jgi:hypothetical protein